MRITGTHFNYYWLCHRKLWLFANGLTMEQDSNLVCEGKMLHQYSYPQRTSKYQEVAIEGIKVDYYDANSKVIHEIKKSNKCDTAHEWQLKYYIYIFERNGITGVKGILEYPLLRKTTEVLLSDVDREDIQAIETNITRIVNQDTCPHCLHKGICKKCSYYEFCYTKEATEEDI